MRFLRFLQNPRLYFVIACLIACVFIGIGIRGNPVLARDLSRAIQDTQLELAITSLLVILLFWVAYEINKRNKPMPKPTHKHLKLMRVRRYVNKSTPNQPQSINSYWEGISTELIGAVISTVLLGMVVLIFQQYASIQNRKDELVLQWGSPNASLSEEARRQLANGEWLYDGSLTGRDLSGFDLSNQNLRSSELTRVILRFADLRGANLSEAILRSANLNRANLDGADLGSADLGSADLSFADLRDAYLASAILSGADLGSVNLRDTNLVRADLSGANLIDAILTNADLSVANLRDASLYGADLSGADLWNALLWDTDLSEATLPDGTTWSEDTDMERFTDPNHPDFWSPCVELDPTPRHCGS